MNRPSDFYVVAKEPGAEHPALPTWANENANPIGLDEDPPAELARIEVEGVPGVFAATYSSKPARHGCAGRRSPNKDGGFPGGPSGTRTPDRWIKSPVDRPTLPF